LEEEERRKRIKENRLVKNEEVKEEQLDENGSGYHDRIQPNEKPSTGHSKSLGINKVDFDDDPEQFAKDMEENLKEIEDVPIEKRAIADSLSQIFDEDIIKHMFSSKWQQRVKGYEMANGYTLSILQKSDDVIAIQKLIFSVIQEGMMDKILHVNLKAMKI
jgi:hypothetical protein